MKSSVNANSAAKLLKSMYAVTGGRRQKLIKTEKPLNYHGMACSMCVSAGEWEYKWVCVTVELVSPVCTVNYVV
jgi:hypothetical protein